MKTTNEVKFELIDFIEGYVNELDKPKKEVIDSGKFSIPLYSLLHDGIEEILKKYAKEKAIEFYDWTGEYLTQKVQEHGEIWLTTFGAQTEQLYHQFINQ